MKKYIYIRQDNRFEEETFDDKYLMLAYENPNDFRVEFEHMLKTDKEFQKTNFFDYYCIGTLDYNGVEFFNEKIASFKGEQICKKSTAE